MQVRINIAANNRRTVLRDNTCTTTLNRVRQVCTIHMFQPVKISYPVLRLPNYNFANKKNGNAPIKQEAISVHFYIYALERQFHLKYRPIAEACKRQDHIPPKEQNVGLFCKFHIAQNHKKAVCKKNSRAISVRLPAKAISPMVSVKNPNTRNMRSKRGSPFQYESG